MAEHESLGHMIKIDNFNNNFIHQYFIPHLPVIKEESITTKLRVVFNYLAPTTTSVSFNDIQINGPIIQNDFLLYSVFEDINIFYLLIVQKCIDVFMLISYNVYYKE